MDPIMDPVTEIPASTIGRVRDYLVKHPHVKIEKVLDIGAYKGTWTRCLKDSLLPDASFEMIEADADHRADLERVCAMYDKVSFHIALLTSKRAPVETTFYKFTGGKYTTGNSMYMENTDIFKANHIPVKMYSQNLDGLRYALNDSVFHDYDLIKIDVQGAELDVILGGMTTVLAAKLLWLELPISVYNIGAPSFADMISFLNGIGFKMVDVIELHYDDRFTLIQIDALFENINC